MKNYIRKFLHSLGLRTQGEYRNLAEQINAKKVSFVDDGHYYSPINDLNHLRENEEQLFKDFGEIRDIDLNLERQIEFLNLLARHYVRQSFPITKLDKTRYFFDNNFFSYSDAIFLFCILLELKPKKVIEVGSGFSSALMLDTNELILENKVNLSFIEPYPEERLNLLLKPSDSVNIIKNFVQDVSLDFFEQLQNGDILFVDSSHVSKFRSDLNFILFQVLPRLNSGVYIHFHDIFYPFEYPKEWILSGRAWNEAYLIRAFLMNNPSYEIVLFPSMLEHFHEDWLQKHMPLTLKLHERWPNAENFTHFLPNKGQSLWLRKK